MVSSSTAESFVQNLGGVGEGEQQEDHRAEADGSAECPGLHGCKAEGGDLAQEEL